MTAPPTVWLSGGHLDAEQVLAVESYRQLTVDGRLKALAELAERPEGCELALAVYLMDETLPEIEYWLYEGTKGVRSPIVALLYLGGHEFVRALVTSEGAERAREKLARDQLRLEEMKEDKNDSYHSSGDTWHDNPGWKDLEQAVQRLERDIRELEKDLLDALTYEPVPDIAETRVTLGSTVTYRQNPTRSPSDRGFELTARIVGMHEQDPDEGIYSYQTPVAHALRGLRVGESRQYKLPAGAFLFTVVSLGQ